MSLPLSPPPSRSASQASFHKCEHTAATYTANSATTSISSSPLTPSSMTSPVSPGTRRPRQSIPTSPSPQTSAFLTSPTPISTACTALRSFFSPCSSDGDDDDDDSDDDDEEIGTPSAQVKPKGHFQRLWASRDPPSTPPSCPPPPVPRRPSALGSPTFGWKPQKTEDDEAPDSWCTPPTIRGSIQSAPAVLPAEDRVLPTGQHSTPPSPTIATGGTTCTEGPPTDPFLSSLHSVLASQLQSLTPLLTSLHPELAAARLARDKLLVKTQKAYFRRASVSGLRVELRAAEERVRRIERSMVTQFLGVLEGIVEGVKDGCEIAMAAEEAAYQEWEQGKQGLDGDLECPPLEIVIEARPKLAAQTSSEETIVPFMRPPPLPPAPQPPQVESPLPSPQPSKLSPSPHPNSSPTPSTTTSISSSTTTSPSSSPISHGRGRLRGGTFGYEACACENTLDHHCANEAWPWDPMVVKVGDVEMRMI
ncbi:hypothetical protein C7212DRAFT_364123 [Tuber magnatum]|uniref:Uncharacterized protein n=1 Tax=Tuber magnatum TaxID=42249 RepID=A0A317SPC0_9PEZI|nr:hypothetical protein C7212DRAFT_364123 [Tuber magnatum]